MCGSTCVAADTIAPSVMPQRRVQFKLLFQGRAGSEIGAPRPNGLVHIDGLENRRQGGVPSTYLRVLPRAVARRTSRCKRPGRARAVQQFRARPSRAPALLAELRDQGVSLSSMNRRFSPRPRSLSPGAHAFKPLLELPAENFAAGDQRAHRRANLAGRLFLERFPATVAVDDALGQALDDRVPCRCLGPVRRSRTGFVLGARGTGLWIVRRNLLVPAITGSSLSRRSPPAVRSRVYFFSACTGPRRSRCRRVRPLRIAPSDRRG